MRIDTITVSLTPAGLVVYQSRNGGEPEMLMIVNPITTNVVIDVAGGVHRCRFGDESIMKSDKEIQDNRITWLGALK